MEIIIPSFTFVVGAVIAAYRLRGDKTLVESLKIVIRGGGGPGNPVTPK